MSRGKAFIKLRKEPKKPQRKKRVPKHFSLDYGQHTLLDVIKWADGYKVPYHEVYYYEDHACGDYGYYGCEHNHHFEIQILEPEEDFQARMESYQVRLKKYNTWYEKNKVLIEKELQRRKEVEEEKIRNKIKIRKATIKREQEKLAAELAKLEEE